MKKINVAILFGGVSPEHDVSLCSAESILINIDKDKYNIFPVGITQKGDWFLYTGSDFSLLPEDKWLETNDKTKAVISPVSGEGLIVFEDDSIKTYRLDCVFPVLHGENGEDGSIQGLMQLAKLSCVGPGVQASAASMDKTLTKLVADEANVRQAKWKLVRSSEFNKNREEIITEIEEKFTYPVFVKPAGTGSSVGVSKASNENELLNAIVSAGQFDEKILVEEFIDGHEVEVAVLGNEKPIASVCGEIVANADFYDYETKYITDCAKLYIPAKISEKASEKIRENAIKVYKALGCRGLSRVDFFLTYKNEEVVFNEINTIPGFTSISMYPKLFEKSGIKYKDLIDKIIAFAME